MSILLTVALVYKSRDLFPEKKTSGLEWGSNPHTHISSVMLYQLSYQALGSKVVGRKGTQVLVLGIINLSIQLYNSIAITVTIHYSHRQEYGLQL